MPIASWDRFGSAESRVPLFALRSLATRACDLRTAPVITCALQRMSSAISNPATQPAKRSKTIQSATSIRTCAMETVAGRLAEE